MKDSLCDKSCAAFSEALASAAPVPGGGGAAAYAGALGAALGMMVGNLTVGRKKYAGAEAEIKAALAGLDLLRSELLTLVDADAAAFLPLSRAYGMPGETPEQQAKKAAVMEDALKDACVVPLKIMRCCGGVIDLQKVMAEKGSALAKSDAGAGAVCAKAALQAASLNVFINAKAMANRAHAEKVVRDARQLLEKYCPLADGVFSRVRETIS